MDNRKNWCAVTVRVSRETEDAVSNILVEAGAEGVVINDSKDYLTPVDQLDDEVFPYVEQMETLSVTAYYLENQSLPARIKDLKIHLSALTNYFDDFSYVLTTEILPEKEWNEDWKKTFKPVRISHQLTIVPSWIDYAPISSEEKMIVLDPGMAFGMGMHATTKLSLWALEQVLRGGETVLDVGTGSGILSIASVLLGAEKVFAYDRDDIAVRVAQENLSLNPVTTGKVTVTINYLLSGVEQRATVIVANILADILMELTADAYRLLETNDYLILSGIISNRRKDVFHQALSVGFRLETELIQEDWHCLILKK